jgi:hypothetical protein
MNYILLTIFTLATAFMVATVSASYTAKSVVLCLGMLAIIVAGLTLFACQVRRVGVVCGVDVVCCTVCCFPAQTRYDFTTAGGMLGSLLYVPVWLSLVSVVETWVWLSLQVGPHHFRLRSNLLARWVHPPVCLRVLGLCSDGLTLPPPTRPVCPDGLCRAWCVSLLRVSCVRHPTGDGREARRDIHR